MPNVRDNSNLYPVIKVETINGKPLAVNLSNVNSTSKNRLQVTEAQTIFFNSNSS